MNVSVSERGWRDLHDTLLQGFQGLMLRLQAIDEALQEGEIKDELEKTLDRGIRWSLRAGRRFTICVCPR
jgi:hypothetical protein